MSSVRGARPVAKSTSSTRSSVPSSSSRTTGPVGLGRPSARTDTPTRTSTPASASPRPMSSPTNGSIRGSRPDPRASRVTEAPSPCQAVAISTPTPPAPTIASRSGTVLLSVAWRLVHGRASVMPGRSGSAGRLPVQMTTACRAVSATLSPLDLVTTTRRGPSNRPSPRISVAPIPLTQSAWPVSSQWAT
ncbi:Uncharacterised protein [Mycobacterium tuberculosis]|nr:Uncharacterised protein [Mycobacterium tuberculosis]COY64409.1 Uncharacterised protein [Mycobacterium tuberculosis]